MKYIKTSIQGGPQSICDALLGKVNPGGKLPFSLPRRSTMIPCYYSKLLGASNEYHEGKGDAIYPFGFGLSYTEFEYYDMLVTVKGKTDVNVKLKIKNVGKDSGDEVVQIYVEDCESSVVTLNLLLKYSKEFPLNPMNPKKSNSISVMMHSSFLIRIIIGLLNPAISEFAPLYLRET